MEGSSGIFWLIPLSTQTENYKAKIKNVECKRGEGNCLIYHIGDVAGQEMVFRICDMIPVTDEYIEGEFIKYGKHYIVEQESLIRAISQKSRNYIRQLKLGRMYSQVDALGIREKLLGNNTGK